jgi:DNA primase
VVEGYFDVIALHSSGVTCAVGCLGTALSSEQLAVAARQLCRTNFGTAAGATGAASRRAPALVLALDSDEAGQKALERLCIDVLPSLVGDRYD